MAQSFSINLLKTTSSQLGPELAPVESRLKRASTWTLVSLLLVGGLTAGAFFTVQVQTGSVEAAHEAASLGVRQLQKAESSFTYIRDRLGRIDKIIGSYKHWGASFEILTRLLVGVSVTSITTDDQNKITVLFKTSSFELVANILSELVAEAQSKTIRNPQLESLQLNEDGMMQVKVAFGSGTL